MIEQVLTDGDECISCRRGIPVHRRGSFGAGLNSHCRRRGRRAKRRMGQS